MKEDIQRVVSQSVRRLLDENGITDPAPEIEVGVPKKKQWGDFSVNTAMVLSGRFGKKPREVAQLIIDNLPEEKNVLFKSVEIAGAGFVNFFLREESVVNRLKEIASAGEKYGHSGAGKGEKVLIEFVSANPTGYLHMGHARNAVVGDTIARLLSATGHRVTREFYINDAGRQMDLLGESVLARYRELLGMEAEIPEDGYKGDYIKEIARSMKDQKGDTLLSELTEHNALSIAKDYASAILLQEIKSDLAGIGVRFDEWYGEFQNIHIPDSGGDDKTRLEKCKDELGKRGALEDKDGALWFRATEFGESQDWVIVKSDGSPTYFLADIAYHMDKFERGFDSLINIWGADHHGHVSRLRSAMRALGYDDSRFSVVLIQFVRLMREGQEVAMSKRSGSYVTLRDVVEDVGPDVTRFFLIMRSSESHLDFDLDLAKKESSENPVYYIQYAYARINSIFNKAAESALDPSSESIHLLGNPEEVELIKKLLFFPEVVQDGALSRTPHKLAFYLQELASEFHVYYNKCRVVDENRERSRARLYLVDCVRTVLSNGLTLLGITTPERM